MRTRAVSLDRELGLGRRCERALVAAARATGAGTRQQLRAAARGFIRRHRHDRSYLSFVLHGVLANSALAIGLLGLAPAPAHATATFFAQQTGAAYPLNGQDLGSNSAPAFADLDGDGDPDLVSGERYGTLIPYYLPEPAPARARRRSGTARLARGEPIAELRPVRDARIRRLRRCASWPLQGS